MLEKSFNLPKITLFFPDEQETGSQKIEIKIGKVFLIKGALVASAIRTTEDLTWRFLKGNREIYNFLRRFASLDFDEFVKTIPELT